MRVNGCRIGDRVRYMVDGVVGFEGRLVYFTRDGWAGIRQGLRVDEVRVDYLVAAE